MKPLQVIEMFAGVDPSGKPFVEQLQVRELDDGSLELVQSPAFVKGLASGDRVKMMPDTYEFNLVKRSGNLSIRVYSRDNIEHLSDLLTPELEKLGGELDRETARMLIYSIHVSCGFTAIEAILNQHIRGDSAWMYGNVYDPADGTTPLNWWQEFLKPE
jgi:Domain of unknown function (DUF4265)